MTDRIRIAESLGDGNLRAFLRMIRAGEGTADEDGYRRHFGGELFESFADHPRRAITKGLAGKTLTSTAAGAYQFLQSTWDECAKAMGLRDFSPPSQDLAAVFLVDRRDALYDVLAGDIETAIAKCAKEWASLPGSPYGQPTKTLAQALRTYAEFGGVLRPVDEPAPIETRDLPKEASMPTVSDVVNSPLTKFALAAINPILGIVPEIAKLFMDGGKSVPERNVEAVVKVVGVAQQALQAAGISAPNEQAVAQAIASDPAAAQVVRKAVLDNYYAIAESGGGGIEGAAKRDERFTAPDGPRFWLSPAFWVSAVLLLMPVALVADMLFVHPDAYAGELRTQVVTAILAVIAMVGGYWIGTSFSSARKTELSGR